jgi:hypothetical protein
VSANHLVLHMVFVLLEHLAIYVDCGVSWKPTPPHTWVPVSCTHYVWEVRGHMKSRECYWLCFRYRGNDRSDIFKQYLFPIE